MKFGFGLRLVIGNTHYDVGDNACLGVGDIAHMLGDCYLPLRL